MVGQMVVVGWVGDRLGVGGKVGCGFNGGCRVGWCTSGGWGGWCMK